MPTKGGLTKGYAGLYPHGPTGLYLGTYRAYDPTAKRWLNRDPIEEEGGANLYAYVGGNPISFIDPLGLSGLRNQGPVNWPPRPGLGSSSSCVTAECAAGLPPAPSDNRTQEQIDYGQCKLVCNISATPAVAACNVAAGGGLPGAVLGNVSKLSACSWVCSK